MTYGVCVPITNVPTWSGRCDYISHVICALRHVRTGSRVAGAAILGWPLKSGGGWVVVECKIRG